MTNEQIIVVTECAVLSATGKAHFGEIVGRLIAACIERYHSDFSRGENTYYTPDGGSCVVPIEHEKIAIAQHFSADGIKTAVRQAQLGEIMYPQFIRQAVAAGCVGYFVQISGSRVQYFGRNGEIHTEWLPGARE